MQWREVPLYLGTLNGKLAWMLFGSVITLFLGFDVFEEVITNGRHFCILHNTVASIFPPRLKQVHRRTTPECCSVCFWGIFVISGRLPFRHFLVSAVCLNGLVRDPLRGEDEEDNIETGGHALLTLVS